MKTNSRQMVNCENKSRLKHRKVSKSKVEVQEIASY